MKTISIVIPCYNEEGNIVVMVEALRNVPLFNQDSDRGAERYTLEIVFVDDGSRDTTWKLIQEMAKSDPAVRGIRFSRNCGYQTAQLAGIREATGDAVITMDADLQHPPSLIPTMVEHWENGTPLVITERRDDAKIGAFKRLTSWGYYKVFRWLTKIPIEPGHADFRLHDRKVVDAINSYKEDSVFLRGLVAWLGFDNVVLPYDVGVRHSGETKFSIKKMLRLALDGAFMFSNFPIRFGLWLGFSVTALSVVMLVAGLLITWFFPELKKYLLPDWATLGVYITFLFGLLFIQIGIIGEYLARTYIEARQRPRYIIADEVGSAREE